MCNLVCNDETWMIGCGRVIRQLSNRLPRFTDIVSHIGGCDDFHTSFPFIPPSFCQSVCFQILWYCRQRGCLNSRTCMLHNIKLFDSSVRQGFCSTSSWYVSSGCCTYTLYKTLVVDWNRFNVFNKHIEFR